MTAAPAETPLQLRISVFCIMAASFIQALDQTIANIALPHMQGSLQADRGEINWVLTSYIVAAAIMTPPSGWLASRFGEKNVLIFSISGFTLASALCGAAQSLDQMVLFRIIQGAIGAPMMAVAQGVLLGKFPLEKRASLMSLWGSVTMFAPILGPTLGGWLTDSYSWRWVFYVNVPIGAGAALGLIFFLKDTPPLEKKRFDGFAFAMLVLALGAFQLILDRGTDQGWFESPEIIAETIICCVGAYLFTVHLMTVGSTLFPPGMFNDRNFVSGVMLTFVTAGLTVTSTALLPPYLQTLGGHSVLEVGMLLGPRGIATLVAIQIVQRTVTKFDPRIFIFLGSATSISTFWFMAHWTPEVSAMTIITVALVQGFGMGLTFIPSSIITFATLPGAYRTDGSAVQNLMRSMGGAIGVSVTSLIISTYTAITHASLAEHVSPLNRNLTLNGPGMMWNPNLPAGAQAIEAVAAHNAAVIAYSDAFYLMFFMGLLAPLIALLMRKPQGIVPIEPLTEA